MPDTPFSTTKTLVVGYEQVVRGELDLLDGKERPRIYYQLMPAAGTLEWLDNKTFLYRAKENTSGRPTLSDSITLALGLGTWQPGSGKTPVGMTYCAIAIKIGDEYRQTPAQQAREAVLPGAVAGPDPRLAQLKAQVGALKSFVDGL